MLLVFISICKHYKHHIGYRHKSIMKSWHLICCDISPMSCGAWKFIYFCGIPTWETITLWYTTTVVVVYLLLSFHTFYVYATIHLTYVCIIGLCHYCLIKESSIVSSCVNGMWTGSKHRHELRPSDYGPMLIVTVVCEQDPLVHTCSGNDM